MTPKRIRLFTSYCLIVLALFVVFGSYAVKAAPSVTYTGVNLAGAEFGVDFGQNKLPGQYGQDYTYPTHDEVNYFVAKGMNTFRIPFRWERLQRQPLAAFDPAEQSRLDDIVQYATSKGAYVVLDPHNYARYYDTFFKVIGQELPVSAYIDFWAKLTARYKNNTRVIFGLMNEPNTMPTDLWRDDANAAIRAIRAAGATNLILVPGNYWTSALNWPYDFGDGTNASSMLNITDSGNNYAFEVHQYLNAGGDGSEATCVSPTIGIERLQSFTTWLQQHGKRGFLGEFAGGRNETCYQALDQMLSYMDANATVWLGWTYWAAGPWWGEYDFTLEPINAVDRPQMMPLSKHFRGTVPPTATATRVPPTATTTATATRVLPTATATRVPSTATATATRVPPTNTPTSTHQAAPCQVAYVVRNDWGYGFIADITVTNKLVTALNQWQFRWTYTGNQVVVDSWNANHSQSSANVTMSGVSWNVTFPANSSITFEIQGAYSGTNNVPKSFTLQNRSCSIQIKTGQ